MDALCLTPADNVAIALDAIAAGARVRIGGAAGGTAVAIDAVPAMHKLAVRPIAEGETIVKYGQPIGVASRPVRAGEHVHQHNCAMRHARQDAVPGRRIPPRMPAPNGTKTFPGLRRPDGRTGTRNYVGIVTTVNCSATVARQIAATAEKSGLLEAFPRVDGVVAITHQSGCGMDRHAEGFRILQRTLEGYVAHPNFGGVLVVGLGCEVMQRDQLGQDGPGLRRLGIQDAGGTRAAIDAGLAALGELLKLANTFEREPVPIGELTLALQCGGSDGYSGITANPALGVAADLLVAGGGSVILAETPEIYGAEHLLIERARSPEVAASLIERLDWWRDHAARNGSTLDSNPTPGNLAGGITTILEKSLGAQAKSGSSSLNAVIGYAERLRERGFNFMDSPGYDPASVTGQVAAGANLICFTTGRGSAFGCKPVPTLKLATNSALYAHMGDDMDLDCGTIVGAGESVADCGRRIFDEILAVASGRKTCSEELGYGDNEFAPWQLGAVY